jgi:UDP:flavonoid glycosyltransferase YjiC (YdhE family)
MPRIIVATTPQVGHVLPILSLLPRLKEQGYDITFITGSASKERVEREGIRHVTLQGIANYDAHDVNQTFPDRKRLQPGPELLDFDFRVLFIQPLADQTRTVQAVLDESDEPAVLITNHMFAGGWPFQLRSSGARPVGLISLGITPLMLSTDALAPFGKGLPPAVTESERQRYLQLRRDFDRDMQGSKTALDAVLSELGIKPLTYSFMDATTLLPDMFLQMTVPGLEYAEACLPPSVKLIGTAPSQVQACSLPAWWSEVDAAKAAGRPVVFVTQGTVARNLEDLVYPTLDALADSNALIIATAGKQGEHTKPFVTPNAYMADYLPYEQILPYVNVMITNGGYGGVQQALRHGVPLVIAGTSEDKAEVAARVAWAGAGINLKTDRPATQDVSEAVTTVLREGRFRRAAMTLSQQYRELDPALALKQAVDSFFQS